MLSLGTAIIVVITALSLAAVAAGSEFKAIEASLLVDSNALKY